MPVPRRLAELVHAELQRLTRGLWSAQDVARFLGVHRNWVILSGPYIDNDRARSALQDVFGDDILVSALDGDWNMGWLLKLKTRPWALVQPRGAVLIESGCGGRI